MTETEQQRQTEQKNGERCETKTTQMKENDRENRGRNSYGKMGLNKNAGAVKKNTGEKNKSGWRMVSVSETRRSKDKCICMRIKAMHTVCRAD